MYCKNCGAQAPEEQKFCSQCGQKLEKEVFAEEDSRCKACGAEVLTDQKFCAQCGSMIEREQIVSCKGCGERVSPDASFCQNCGQPITVTQPEPPKPQPIICQGCGKVLEQTEQFCKFCGQKAINLSKRQKEDNQQRKPIVFDSAKKIGNDLFGNLKKSLFSQTTESKLAWKYAILSALFVLMIVLWSVPAINIEIEILELFFSDSKSMDISMVSPLGDVLFRELVSEYFGSDETQILGIVTTLAGIGLFIIPFFVLAVCSFLPIVNKTVMKKRTMIFQSVFSFLSCFLTVAFWLLLTVLFTLEDVWEYASVGLTFGGWLIVIVTIAIGILSAHIRKEGKRLALTESVE